MDRRLIRAVGIAFFAIWLGCVYRALGIELGLSSAYLVLGALGLVFALAIAFPKLAAGFARAIEAPKPWLFLLVTTLAAVGITLWLSLGPMRGMPASLDGSVYVFQARALAHLSYGHPIPPPRLPFGVRFLFEGADGNLHGVFPVGLPLFLAPFLALGSLHLGLATIAVGLVLVQYAVAKALTKSELVARASVLLTLPSWGRAIETAEPVSHSLVAICVGAVFVLTLELPKTRRPFLLALLLGAAGALAFITRLLDGFVIAFLFGPLLLYWAATKRIPRSTIAAIVLGALPFLAVIFGQQHAATGSIFRPNVVEYALRSDWPPGCLRLGIGKDIGCKVEHPNERESFGPDGYQIDDAYRLIRERAEVYGFDLVGSGIVFLLAFVPLMLAKRDEREEEPDDRLRTLGVFLATGFVVVLTLAYGLYYYGNHPAWGARHLYASSPFAFALIALAAERFATFAKKRPVAPAFTFALLAAALVSACPMWKRGVGLMRSYAAGRVDVRALIEEHGVERGIITTVDLLAYLNGFDPWTDGDQRIVVFDGPAGAHDLRRLHPTLPVYEAKPPNSFTRIDVPPPPHDFYVELERAWPAFMRPSGLGALFGHTRKLFDLGASSGHGLYVFEASPGAKVTIPIWIPASGRYSVRLHYFEGPDLGDYKVTLDGHVLPLLRGYHPQYRRVGGAPSVPIELEAGTHELVVECLGKHESSSGYRALLDVFSGTKVEEVEKAALP